MSSEESKSSYTFFRVSLDGTLIEEVDGNPKPKTSANSRRWSIAEIEERHESAQTRRSSLVVQRQTRLQIRHDHLKQRRQMHRLVDQLMCDLEIKSSRLSYEEMQSLMMKAEIIHRASQLVQVSIGSDQILNTQGRIFLGAILLARFPKDAMPAADEEEEEEDERQLLVLARSVLEAMTSVNYHQEIPPSYLSFEMAFRKWRAATRPDLEEHLVAEFRNMREIKDALQGEALMEWQPHIDRHQNKVVAALRRVSGSQAVESLSTESVNSAPAEAAVALKEQTAPPQQPEMEREAAGILNKIPLDNEWKVSVCHELMLDGEFDLKRLLGMRQSKQPLASIHMELADQRTFAEFVTLIQKQLVDMLPLRHPKISIIEGIADADLLLMEAESDSIDCVNVLNALLGVMSELCAPMRDALLTDILDQLNRIDSHPDIWNTCVRIKEAVELMHHDLVNYHLLELRPHLEPVIVDMEREWFAKNVLLTLQTEGFKEHVQEMAECIKNEGACEAVTAQRVIAESMVRHLFDSPPVTSNVLLAALDQQRMRDLNRKLNSIARYNALMLLLAALKHPEVVGKKHADIPMATGLKGGVELKSKHRSVELSERLYHLMVDVEDWHASREEIESFLCDAKDLRMTESAMKAVGKIYSETTDPVLALVLRRLQCIVRSVMLQGTVKDHMMLVRTGIRLEAVGDVMKICSDVSKWHQLHVAVLAPIYSQFLLQ